ncbi:DEAD/DEAH box helicase family protein [Kordiimonas sp.]|uniref:DEAD/DEAH box helicase family protein n=1 Tax=Kordiimonas sp. TaxID=1970157 RepID=UPI003A8EE98C
MSQNFNFIKPFAPELYTLCSFSEQYAYSDPESAYIKLRVFAEEVVKSIYQKQHFVRAGTTLAEMLTGHDFKAAVPQVVQTKFHAIRKEGNKAAHGGQATSAKAVWLIKEAHELAGWFCATFHNMPPAQFPKFVAIAPTEITEATNKALEAELSHVLAELDKAKAQYAEAAQTAEVLKAKQAQSQKNADLLHISEADTRQRLIDVALLEAGWKTGKKGVSTDEVGQEVPLTHTVPSLDKGFADYVLWDDNGLPLAVIEAKKTSSSAKMGRKQAQLYADALEAQYGQRPVIFYTNGYDIYVWDDALGYPPRQIFGFYGKDSLQYLVNSQRKERQPLDSLLPNPEIAGRTYQIEGIKRVCEKLEKKQRKALIVQATGTGKTRVAVALTDLLMRAGWVKRTLFLCDRKELRKQAKNAYTDFLKVGVSIGGKKKATDKTRITVATYPGMMQRLQQFDVGYFDLIIADESHRSIYNMYRDLFRYFDCFQVGLTATPVGFINKNTFRMFECEPDKPTTFYSLERAVKEEYLVPYEVYTHTTKFLRDGIRYSELTPEQRAELEENGELPEDFDFDAASVNKTILNKDTNRHIIRNLLENGLRDVTGQSVGKSIIFARSHDHAVLLEQTFDEMFPQYGGKYCQVIDSHDSRAEQLIDDFKGDGDNDELTIAISVDMLDTGIDIPEVLNLVFAKPVKSKVKFWQMIGRGTRLCEDLFGPGKHKTKFRIFDHWSNFEFFEEERKEAVPVEIKSIRQKLFEIRLALATVSLEQNRKKEFKAFTRLIASDVRALPTDSISVKEKWREVQAVAPDGVIDEFAPVTAVTLAKEIAPLMKWIDMRGHGMAYSFDLLVSHAEYALLKGSGDFRDLKERILALVANLKLTLPQVRPHLEMINRVKSAEFWDDVDMAALEELRKDLRGIIKYQHEAGPRSRTKIVDLTEDIGAVKQGWRATGLKSIDMKVYRLLVEEALERLFDADPTLRKIRRGEPVTEAEIAQLSSLVLTRNPGVRLELLEEFYPDLAGHLDLVIRSIVGMEKDMVREKFTGFVHAHPSLSADQVRFLDMLQNHIAKNGRIRVEQLLTEAPFTSMHPDGIDGLFDDKDADELIRIAREFEFPVTEGQAQ